MSAPLEGPKGGEMNQPTTTDRGVRTGPLDDEDGAALARVAHLDPDSERRRAVRDEVVCRYLPQARSMANRFAGYGEPIDDLVQVAVVGLLHAADRYDPAHGVPFLAYAAPTMLGELRHYFRDSAWGIRVNRRLQELNLQVRRTADDMTQELGRAATDAEIAERIGVPAADVREGRAAGAAYRIMSLNAPVAAEAEDTELGDQLGCLDGDIESFADRHVLAGLVARLPASDRMLLELRFTGNLTQSQIGERIGVSQMQVSRLLAGVLGRLREALLSDELADEPA
jgi:RNA polymerase sigma-B factor